MKKRLLSLRPPNKVRVHPMPCVKWLLEEGSGAGTPEWQRGRYFLMSLAAGTVGETETKTHVAPCLQDSQPWESVRTMLHVGQLLICLWWTLTQMWVRSIITHLVPIAPDAWATSSFTLNFKNQGNPLSWLAPQDLGYRRDEPNSYSQIEEHQADSQENPGFQGKAWNQLHGHFLGDSLLWVSFQLRVLLSACLSVWSFCSHQAEIQCSSEIYVLRKEVELELQPTERPPGLHLQEPSLPW